MKPGAALWRTLAEGADLLDTAPGWAARLGPDHADVGPLLVSTTRHAAHWPCGGGRDNCWRRLVEEGDGLMAVCVDDDWTCEPEAVRRADAWLHRLDHGAVVAAARRGLGLAGDGLRRVVPGAWWVGARAFGEVAVAFYLATEPDRAVLDAVTADADPDSMDLVVLLAAAEPDPATAALARQRRIDVRPLPSMAELRDGGALAFDLDRLILGHRFRGLDDPTRLLTDRVRLLLHPMGGCVWLDGEAVALSSRAKLQWAFLGALARRPGRNVSRRELLPEVYDSYGDATSGQEWDKRLKQVRDELPDAPWPITAVPGSFEAGGYRLDLTGEQVAWWSDPPQERRAKPGKRRAGKPTRRGK